MLKHLAKNRQIIDVEDVFYFLQQGIDSETEEGITMNELGVKVSRLMLAGKQFSLSATRFAIPCLASMIYEADTTYIDSRHTERLCRSR